MSDYAALRGADPVSAGLVPEASAAASPRPSAPARGCGAASSRCGRRWPSPFTEADERRLEGFAELIGLAVTNAEVHGRLRALAATDPLTGLANHRAFQERLAEEVARARRYGHPLALSCSTSTASSASTTATAIRWATPCSPRSHGAYSQRPATGDLMARVGGEEFAWLLPDTALAGAESLAERVRHGVELLPFPRRGALTASLGVAELGADDDGRDLFRSADLALSGRRSAAATAAPATRPTWRGSRSPRSVRAEGDPGRLTPSGPSRSSWMPATPTCCATPSAWRGSRRPSRSGSAGPPTGARRWARPRWSTTPGRSGCPRRRCGSTVRSARSPIDRIRGHAVVGAEIASRALTPEQVSWVRGHHERWDGRGYPDGLAAEAIPEGARILAVADAWEAMTSPRAWRPALPRERPGRDAGGRGHPVLAPRRPALLALAAVDPRSALDGESVTVGR